MSDVVEFDPDELEQLVAEALEEIKTSSGRALFSFGDTRVLEKLSEILPRYVQHHGDVSVILDELRGVLYEGMVGQNSDDALRQMHTIVKHCRKCPLMQPDPKLPHWNLSDPDAIFITDTPLSGTRGDQHLIETLKSSGFRSSRIMATSVVRCFPQEHRIPNVNEVSTCSTRYLFTELQLLQPKLIVAVGGLAAGVLLGEGIKITQERGKIFWVGPWAVLPTFSPGYAMRHTRTQEALATDIQYAHDFVYGK